MAQYSGKVDDYLQSTSGALEVATDIRYLPMYDPETNDVAYFKIDVSERGGKEVDKLLTKTIQTLTSAQSDLMALIEKIEAGGGGTRLVRRPKEMNAKAKAKESTEQPEKTDQQDEASAGPAETTSTAPDVAQTATSQQSQQEQNTYTPQSTPSY